MTDKGVWDLQDVRDKSLKGDWNYQTPDGPFTLWAWSNNNNPSNRSGMLGLNDIVQRSSPTQIGTNTTWKALSASSYWTTATKTDGTLWVWGSGYGGGYGLLGLNAGSQQFSSPTQIGTDTNWLFAQSRQPSFNGGIKRDGTLWMWGINYDGKLGINRSGNVPNPPQRLIGKSSPTQVPGTNWGNFAMNSANVAAVKTDGTLWTWGAGGGVLLQNLPNPSGRSSPTQVGTDTDWSLAVSIGSGVAGGVKTDGTLWIGGSNGDGQLGQNNLTSYSSPTQVPGTTWSTNKNHWAEAPNGGNGNMVLTIKTDGSLWGWGESQYQGRLGLNQTTVSFSSPVQVGADKTWSSISLLGNTASAIKTDGTLWSWGWNSGGALGGGWPTPTRYSSPTQVGTATNWALMALGADRHMGAVKTDGTMWTWGNNDKGALGQNDSSSKPSAGQVPGTYSTVRRNCIGETSFFIKEI